jgi:regulator of sirC expression with transglutaminase-like and TPR domain
MVATWRSLSGAKNDNEALKWCEKALSRLEQETELRELAAGAARNIAFKLSNEKKYKESIPFLDRQIELIPADPYACTNRGHVYLELKEYQKAIADFDRAIHLEPLHAHPYNGRGNVYLPKFCPN